MEKDNYDFYQEALKAFDAPIPKPEEEEPAPEPAAQEAEPAPQVGSKRKFNPWWVVAACAILCLALVIGVGGGVANQSRGENYVYGILLEATDEYMIISHHQMFWYVELDGLENPTNTFGVDTYLWVFYNGEAEDTDERGCHKKITATYWKAAEDDLLQKDEIKFDLDGDGNIEIWSVERAKLGDVIIGIAPLKITLRAEDAQGNVLHDVFFYGPSVMDGIVFNNAGGKLSIIVSRLAAYEVLEMAIEDGRLTVRQDGEAMQLYPAITGPLMTLPPITIPEVPTIGQEETYAIRFFLHSSSSGSIVMTEKQVLTGSVGADLKRRLDGLAWKERDSAFESAGNFMLYVNNLQFGYSFSHDGTLLHEGKVAKIGAGMKQTLLELMGWEMLAEQMYLSSLESGAWGSINFYDSGEALLKIAADFTGSDTKAYLGRYATFGDYYYLALGEKLDQILVLRRKAHSFEYVADMSAQNLFQANGKLEFRLMDRGGSVAVNLRDSDGGWTPGLEYATLGVAEVWQLRRMLENCDWQTERSYSDDEIVASFTIHDGIEEDQYNPTRYYLLTGCRLLRPITEPGGKEAIAVITEQYLWQMLMELFQKQGETVSATYTGLNQDGMELSLKLNDQGSYELSAQLKREDGDGYSIISESSSYVRLGKTVVLFGWHDGPYYVHLDHRDDKLFYNAACSMPNTGFSQTTQVTLMNLHVERYRHVFLRLHLDGTTDYSVGAGVSEGTATMVSATLRTIQWKKLDSDPEGIPVVSFEFRDAYNPYKSATLYSGMRLVRDGYEAQLTQLQWSIFCKMLIDCSSAVNATICSTVDGVSYALMLNDQHQLVLCLEGKVDGSRVLGMYSVIDNRILLGFGYHGQVFVLQREEEGWRLLPGCNGIETFDIPDGTIFGEPIVDSLPVEDATPA